VSRAPTTIPLPGHEAVSPSMANRWFASHPSGGRTDTRAPVENPFVDAHGTELLPGTRSFVRRKWC